MKVLHACPWADTATGRTQPVRTAQDRVWDPSSPGRSPKEQALELLDHVLRGRARLTTTHLWLIVSDSTHKTTWPKVTRCRHSRQQRRRFCISQRKKVFTLSSTTQHINFYVTKNSKRCFAPKESNNKLHENDRAFLYPAGPGRDRVQEHEVFDHRAAAGRHHPQLHKYSKGMTTF